jgi:hypothetical protein
MPSRKKAQGKSRKAKQNPKYGSHSCKHFDQSLCSSGTQIDEKMCINLYEEFKEKVNEVVLSGICGPEHSMKCSRLSHQTYLRYCELNTTSQSFFRDTLLTIGTRTLLRELNKASDISDLSTCANAWPLVELYVYIEVLENEVVLFEPSND